MESLFPESLAGTKNQNVARNCLVFPIVSRTLFLLFAGSGVFDLPAAQPLLIIHPDTLITQRAQWDGEPFLLVNPRQNGHLVLAWMAGDFLSGVGIRVMVSQDGGSSWSPPVSIPHLQPGWVSADPSLGIAEDGTIYLAYVDFSAQMDEGYILLRRSENGGYSWSDPDTVVGLQAFSPEQPVDRPWLAVHSSRYLLVTSMSWNQNPLPNFPFYHLSRDSGKTFVGDSLGTGNFSAGPLISAPMPVPASLPGGFVIVYPSYLPDVYSLPRMVLVRLDTSGVLTYSHAFSWVPRIEPVLDSLKMGYTLQVNPSNPDHLLFVFPAWLFSESDVDIWFTESLDGGQTWSPLLRLNDDTFSPPGTHQDLVWMCLSESGATAVVWRDRRHGRPGANSAYDFYLALRLRPQEAWLPNLRLTRFSIPPHPDLFRSGNDFLSCAFARDTLWIVWGDTRTGAMNLVMTMVVLSSTGTGYISRKDSSGTLQWQVRWMGPDVVRVETGPCPSFQVSLLDLSGRVFQRISGTYPLNVRLSSGVWILQMECTGALHSRFSPYTVVVRGVD